MKRYMILVLLIFLTCDSSEETPETVDVGLTDSIAEEAAGLGNFPDDAQVTELDKLTVNGENIEGTDSVELPDTEKEAAEVEVTLPSSLSRKRNKLRYSMMDLGEQDLNNIFLWLNGTLIPLSLETVELEGNIIRLEVALNIGPNYFFLIFSDNSGTKYRSVVVKINRLQNTSEPTEPAEPAEPAEAITHTTTFTLEFATENKLPVSAIDGIAIQASGSDFSPISASFSYGDTLTLDIPEGNSRTISVIATTASTDSSAALEFTGNIAVDVSSAHSHEVSMRISKTKLLVPDARKGALVQIDSINGENWQFRDNFYQEMYDVDFDDAGRIYTASYSGESGAEIMRLDSFSDTTPETLVSSSSTYNYVSVSVDRSKAYLYYIQKDPDWIYQLVRMKIGTTTEEVISGVSSDQLGATVIFNGIDIENGTLFIAAEDGETDKGGVYSYTVSDSGTATYAGKYNSGNPAGMDVLLKDGFVYLADSANKKILQFDTSLNYKNQLIDSAEHNLYGPIRFLGISDSLIFIDEDYSGDSVDQLVSIDGISGTAYKTYGSYGTGEETFWFYK